MASHSSTLAWRVPWTEEHGRLQSMGSQRVRHDWATSLSLFTSCIGEGNGNPLQCSCLENPKDSGAWWAAIYGVAQSRIWLKQLSSSSSSFKENEISDFQDMHYKYIVWIFKNMLQAEEVADVQVYITSLILHIYNISNTSQIPKTFIHIFI